MKLSPTTVKELVDIFERSALVTMHVKSDDGELLLSSEATSGASMASPQTSAAAAPASVIGDHLSPTPAGDDVQEPGEASGDALVPVTAPALGAFYHAPRPDQPPYVQVGSRVESDTTVGLIEAMKVYTAVAAGVSGIVREIIVDDNDFVEFGQVLLKVEPEGGDAS